MKKIFILLLAGVAATACVKPEATLKAEVVGVPDSTRVFVVNNDGARLDSTMVKSGKFEFKFAKAYPDQAFVVFDGLKTAPMAFFVEPGAITALIDVTTTPLTVTFGGTATNLGALELADELKPYDDKAAELLPAVQAAQGTPAFDSLYAAYDAIAEQRKAHIDNFVLGNPATVLAAYLAADNAHALSTPEMVDSVLSKINAAPVNAFTDKLVARRELLAATAVGQPAPDFTQNQVDGTPVTLSSFKGKLVLVDFWASWCGPCRMENPNVVALYNNFKDKGFEIIGVSLDNNREAWTQAIQADGLTWIHVSDLKGWQNSVAKQYGVQSIPHTVLVGTDGKIVAKGLRGEALAAKVAELLNETLIEQAPVPAK